jgi:hypothetical protein
VFSCLHSMMCLQLTTPATPPARPPKAAPENQLTQQRFEPVNAVPLSQCSIHFSFACPWHCLRLRTRRGCACRYWLAVGADPSERVTSLLSKAGLIPPPPLPPKFPKAQPKAKE